MQINSQKRDEMSNSLKAVRAVRGMSQPLSILLLLLTCSPLSARNQEHRVRKIVLVHGAWADGSGWKGSEGGSDRTNNESTTSMQY